MDGHFLSPATLLVLVVPKPYQRRVSSDPSKVRPDGGDLSWALSQA